MDLRSRTPIASTGFIEFDERLEGSDDGRFSVHGREGFNADGSPCGELLALDFVPWTEWLGTAIAEQTLLKATPPSIIAHCLWEMTFWGGDGNGIQAMVNSTNDDPEQAS